MNSEKLPSSELSSLCVCFTHLDLVEGMKLRLGCEILSAVKVTGSETMAGSDLCFDIVPWLPVIPWKWWNVGCHLKFQRASAILLWTAVSSFAYC